MEILVGVLAVAVVLLVGLYRPYSSQRELAGFGR